MPELNSTPSGLTAEYVRSILDYDPTTGIFTWKVSRGGRATEGRVAGSVKTSGRVRIKLNGRLFFAHRLAWLHVKGEWPPGDLDHRDGNGLNNRIGNLRPATQSENNANTRRRSDNTSGFKGVIFRKDTGRWRARICLLGKFLDLGNFDAPEQAHGAYCRAARKIYGEFARVS